MRTICLLLILIALSFSSFSQVNDSLLDPNRIWYTHIHIYCCWQFDTEVISLGQDTTINDTNYYEVNRSTGGVEIPDQFYGLIREDSSQRVFYRSSYENSEKLLYDFDLAVKDTITVYGLSDRSKDIYDECQYVCDSISDEVFNEIQRKVIHVSAIPEPVTEKWIEGIGSTTGLLHHYDGRVGGDAFDLSCVRSSEGYLFRKSETEPCVKTNIGIVDREPSDILIFPNPTFKNIGLSIKNIPPGATIEIYSMVGSLVYRRLFFSSEESIRIEAESGIFLYRIFDSNNFNIKTGKLFIY